MDMPESRDNYNLDKIIGNINLVEGRFMIKSEADEIINHHNFLILAKFMNNKLHCFNKLEELF